MTEERKPCISATTGGRISEVARHSLPVSYFLPVLPQDRLTELPLALLQAYQTRLQAAVLWENAEFLCQHSACCGEIQKIAISEPVSLASSINNKFRKYRILNKWFGCFPPAPKRNDLMFSKHQFF